MIVLSNVTMRYPVPKRYVDLLFRPFEDRWTIALRDASLRVASGDSLAVLGPNGAGKTTLLRLIGGLIYPSYGSVAVNGFDTVRHNLEARGSVGFVVNDERSFYWRLSGLQNLEFFGALDGLTGGALRRRSSDLLGLVGLEADGNKRVSDYSTGMRQRLAMARGLLCDPDVLLLDEPTRSLDPVGADHMRSLVATHLHVGKRRTLVIATHNMQEAETLCNQVCCIFRGKVLPISECAIVGAQPGGLAGYYRSELQRVESGECDV